MQRPTGVDEAAHTVARPAVRRGALAEQSGDLEGISKACRPALFPFRRCLVVHHTRFYFQNEQLQMKKLNYRVAFPTDALDLRPFVSGPQVDNGV